MKEKTNKKQKYDIKDNILKKSRKKKIIIGVVIALVLLLIGTSLAIWGYNYVTNLNVLGTGQVKIEFLESSNDIIQVTNAIPLSDEEGKKIDDIFTFQVTTEARDISFKYNLNIEKLQGPEGYTNLQDDEVKIYLTDYEDNPLVGPLLISELNNYNLYSKVNTHTNNNEIKNKYKLRVWIDESAKDNYDWSVQNNLAYNFKIGVGADEYVPPLDQSGANAPVLDTNMIAVYYDETEEVWKKADSTNSNADYKWYDYDNKMWANSVTVSEANRQAYLNADLGTTIPMDDILTMQVWIPRYKYKVWNYNSDGTATSEPQEIEIVFEEGTGTTGEITCTDTISGTDGAKSESCKINNTECTDSTCNGKYYTHPAFTFGEEELEGFWIGKFELTVDIDNITTKPNISSLRSQKISTYETNIMKMNDSGNIYGLSTTTDTHMIKNMEWGAASYLSHSKYGTCTNGTCEEVYINNSSGYYTGRSGGNVGGSTPINGTYTDQTSTTQYNSYGFYTYDGYLLEYGTNTKSSTKDISKVASTTGNIYGVYDMSGGAEEYVMGNIVSNDGTTMMSGNSSSIDNSGYTGIVYNSGNYTSYTGTYSYPDAKYYDKYSFGTDYSQRQRSKLGDGIKEVYNTSYYGWYSDISVLAYSVNPWFIRGGYYDVGSAAGAFHSYHYHGYADSGNSSRLVITP